MTIDLGPWLGGVPAAAAERIAGARRALIASHENPDADTLGAALGIAAIVERGGGQVELLCADPVPPLYGFLAGMDRFRADPEPTFAPDMPPWVYIVPEKVWSQYDGKGLRTIKSVENTPPCSELLSGSWLSRIRSPSSSAS